MPNLPAAPFPGNDSPSTQDLHGDANVRSSALPDSPELEQLDADGWPDDAPLSPEEIDHLERVHARLYPAGEPELDEAALARVDRDVQAVGGNLNPAVRVTVRDRASGGMHAAIRCVDAEGREYNVMEIASVFAWVYPGDTGTLRRNAYDGSWQFFPDREGPPELPVLRPVTALVRQLNPEAWGARKGETR